MGILLAGNSKSVIFGGKNKICGFCVDLCCKFVGLLIYVVAFELLLRFLWS